MHHILRGAFGAAVVYPLAWYYYSGPGAVQAIATDAARSSEQQQDNTSRPFEPVFEEPAQPAVFEPASLVREERVAHSASRSVPATAPQLALPIEPELPRGPELPRAPKVAEPKVEAPNLALPAFPELQEILGQMKDLQQHAHDPRELEKRVQAIEEDPQKVARLRAIADMFVKLPPSRGESYLPAGDTRPSTPSR